MKWHNQRIFQFMDQSPVRGSGSMDPVSLGLVGASTIAGVLGGIFGGGDAPPDPNAKALPYEYELSMLNNFDKGMEQLDQAHQHFQNLTDVYTKRLDLIDQGLKNLIPSDQLQQQLADNSAKLAASLGMSAQELAKKGFLSADDAADLDKLNKLNDQTSVELAKTDPTIQRERQILTQQLQRQGITGAALEQALRDFDVKSGETIKQSKFAMGTNLIQTRAGLRQQGFQQATTSLAGMQSELGRIQGVYGDQAKVAGEKYASAANMASFQVGLVNTKQDLYDKLGKYNFSDRVKGAIARGEVGPTSAGSYIQAGTKAAQSLPSDNIYSNKFTQESDAMIQLRLRQAQNRPGGAVRSGSEYTAVQEEARRRGLI